MKTIAAVHRLIATRVEWHLGHTAAIAAGRLEHLTRTRGTFAATTSHATAVLRAHGFARGTAIGATVRFVLKTFLLVKALLTGAEDELPATIHAVQHLIDVHERETPLSGQAPRTESKISSKKYSGPINK
ncbi:MAG TPA: hypothetical protein VF741_10085 [Candidatus Aquilonibacter sp.]